MVGEQLEAWCYKESESGVCRRRVMLTDYLYVTVLVLHFNDLAYCEDTNR